MESIVVNPKNKAEFDLLTALLDKMKIDAKVLSEEDKEDLGLALLMKEVNRNEMVSRDEIFKKLTA